MTLRLDTLGALAARYDAFLVDQFGVLLNGAGAYPFAPGAMRELSRLGKTVLLLSNSGKRSAQNEARLERLGFDRASFLAVLSSGETAHEELARQIGVSVKRGARVWAHSMDEGVSPLEGLDLAAVKEPVEADLLLIAGCRPWAFSLEDYSRLLKPAAAAGIRCLCANPDMTTMFADGLQFGPGRVARLYEGLGGRVDWFGKPHRAIYAEALRRLSDFDRRRIVCVGDSPAHDILGGRRAGLATALVRTGVHADESEPEILERCQALGAPPDFLLERFEF